MDKSSIELSIEQRKEALRLSIGSLALEGEKPTERTIEVLNLLVENKISFDEASNLVKSFD
ncbi:MULTISPECIES: antitoxin VbhA family protein [Oligella]|uniref:Uncharacterized protein n=1 Tax=Oligella urethralis TaxID=90245 RepID=A0A2X1UV55_9BURK|nr:MULTISPECIES: antitoxin VbhA family protein [Oligella]OFS83376.1 hypothetical protein HMPREF3144_08995 [Oligella sp. HMSC05A10]SPY08281.1 Uncharacterised protein [Oligella urethralis]SUA61355.1 Uncharacterised protein [Oligella urethralis]